jgi:hypothetical protein
MIDDAFTLPSRCQNITLDALPPYVQAAANAHQITAALQPGEGKATRFRGFWQNFGLERVRIFLLYRRQRQNGSSNDASGGRQAALKYITEGPAPCGV